MLYFRDVIMYDALIVYCLGNHHDFFLIKRKFLVLRGGDTLIMYCKCTYTLYIILLNEGSSQQSRVKNVLYLMYTRDRQVKD